MVTLRVARAGLASDAAKLRVARAGLTGTASTVPKLRVARAGLTGVAAIVVNPLTPQTVEPEITVTVTATTPNAGTPTWTWRVVSGIAVTFAGTGATRTFKSPSLMPPAGGSTTVGVTVTIGGTTSPEQTCVISYLPQTSWWFDGTQWQGRRPPVDLIG